MKKYSAWELICIMFASTVCIVLVSYMLMAILYNQSTNAVNLQVRLKLIDLLNNIQGAVIAIAAMKINNLNKE